MSKTVDNRVVEMRFDNQQFESNVKTSMSTLEKLKNALKFSKSSDGLENISKSINRVNVSGLTKGIETVSAKFSALQVVGITALSNITSAAMSAGKNIASALTIQPVTDGFREYETQINSVQTILANTQSKGTTLDQVNKSLDELNKYADQTIYNFGEMTRNIGTFTAAGVDLETSVTSIKGIANLAAMSGSSSAQAATAMYQLSQAIAAGKVQLMDWNSVVNAGMGGEVFQNALKRTATAMGTNVDAMIEKYGSFRESLTRGEWLTADVLTETLTQLSGAYTEADLIAKGYTEQQAKDIVQLADTASKAATEVKTFTGLIGTVQEALGSGWAQTWEIIIGDFTEAKGLFTEISSTLGAMIDKSAESRNELVQGWKDLGGRDMLIESLSNSFEALLSIIKPVSEAFREIFPPMTAEKLVDLTEGFKEFTEGLKLSDEASANLKNTFSGIFAVIDMFLSIVSGAVKVLFSFSDEFSEIGNAIFKVVGDIGSFIASIADATSTSEAFSKISDGIVSGLDGITTALSNIADIGFDVISSIITGIGSAFQGIGSVIGDAFSSIWDTVSQALSNSDINSILNIFNSGVIGALALSLTNFVRSFTGNFKKSTGSLVESITDFVDDIGENVGDILDTVRGSLVAWQTSIKAATLLQIAAAVGILAFSLTMLSGLDKQAMTDALGAITTMMLELVAALAVLTKLTFGAELLTVPLALIGFAAAISILAGSLKKLSELNIDQLEVGIIGIAGLATVIVAAAKLLSMGTGSVIKGATGLVIFSGAMKLLASVCADLSELDVDSLTKGLVSLGFLLGEIAGFMALANLAPMSVKSAAAILIVSGSLKVLANTVDDFAAMDSGAIGKGLLSIGLALGEIIFFSTLLKGAEANIIKASTSVAILGAAIFVLVPSLERLGAMSLTSVASSLIALGGGLRAIVGAMLAIPEKNMMELATLIPAMATSLLVIAQAFEKFNTIDPFSIAKGIIAFALALKVLVASLIILAETLDAKEIKADLWGISSVLPAMASSLLIIAEAMEKVSALSWDDVIRGIFGLSSALLVLVTATTKVKGLTASAVSLVVLSSTLFILSAAIALLGKSGIIGTVSSLVALAGAFTIVGVAAKMLKPLVPSIFSLSVSIATLGASLIALGAGIGVIGVGLVTFFTSLVTAIYSLKGLSLEDVGIGVAAIAAAFVAIGVAGTLLRPVIPSILSLAGSIALLGLSCLAIGSGIAVFVAALSALSAMSQTAVSNSIANLEIIIVGFLDMIPSLASSIVEAIKVIAQSILQAIVELAPQIVDGLLEVLTLVIGSLAEYTPQLVGFLFDFLIGLINGVADRMPELINAFVNLIKSIFSGVLDALSGLSFESVVEGVIGVGLLSGMMYALASVAALTGPAMLGVLGMGAVIAELSLVLATIGALKQIPGLEWFIGEGGDLLQTIGTAIGQFAGGIVGGIAEGATSALPQIGTNLSDFMTNLKPFIDGISLITPEISQSMKNLADAIFVLTGANFLDAITSFISGGASFKDFAEQLVPLGVAISTFGILTDNVNPEKISATSQAAKTLIEALSTVPNSGGFLDKLFGGQDFETFNTSISGLGEALNTFYTNTSEIDPEKISATSQAAKTLIEALSTVPNSGGFLDKLFGGQDFGAFNESLTGFGTAVNDFYTSTADIEDADKFATVANAAKTLVEGLSSIESSGGFLDKLFGGQDFGAFNESLTGFGTAVNDFYTSTADIEDADKFSTVVTAAKTLIEGLSSISPEGGIIADMLSGTDYTTFSTSLSSFGNAISNFASSVMDASFDNVESAMDAADKIVDVISAMSRVDMTKVDEFKTAVDTLAEVNINGLVEAFSSATADLSSVGFNIIKSIVEGFDSNTSSLTDAAENACTGVIDTINGRAGDFTTAGIDTVNAIATGFDDVSPVVDATTAMMQSALDSISGYEKSFYDTGIQLVSGFAAGISDNIRSAADAAASMALSASSAAKANLDINSPSRVFREIGSSVPEGFAMGISMFSQSVTNATNDMADNAVDGAKTAMLQVTNVLDSDLDVNPTIRPVLDLSDIKAGARSIDGMFGQTVPLNVIGNANRINRMMDVRNQNGVMSDLSKSVKKLNNMISDGKLGGDTINVNGVHYSEGTDVASAVKDLTRAIRMERRV